MGSLIRSFVQSLLKLVNSVIGMVGIAMIMYSVWMIRVWVRHMGDLSHHPAPWFISTFLGLGVTLSVITCFGHMAAETANGCCLYLYMLVIFVLLMLEGGITADVFLNHDWEEDFPDDPTGFFNQFKFFIQSNFEICKWVGLSIVAVQAISFILAMVLKAFRPIRYYDSDDEFDPATAPLLTNAGHLPRYAVGDRTYGTRK